MIRVILVDDSPMALHVLQSLLRRCNNDIEVIGTATNGKEALALLPELKPDVICTDLHMPVMNGLELTRAVMASQPTPILVISVSVQPDSMNVFQLLEAGAIDVILKPRDILAADQDKLARNLAAKIRILAGVHVFRNKPKNSVTNQRYWRMDPSSDHIRLPAKIVVIGASTGGPQTLNAIMRELPKTFPTPIVCVQHIGADFLTELVLWLAKTTPLPIALADHGQMPRNGHIYFAPAHNHLTFDDLGRFALSDTPAYDGHRPSITVAMKSAAQCYGAATVGVLLTGMGCDGATGMAEIVAVGGVTIAQDEASSVIYGMPQAAVAAGGARHILALDRIAPALLYITRKVGTANDLSKSLETL